MIELNYNFQIGDKVELNNFSWQYSRDRITGIYEIIDREKDPDGEVFGDTVILKRITDGLILSSDFLLVAYATGKEVSNPPCWVGINGEKYQPALDDTNILNDLIETDIDSVYVADLDKCRHLIWGGFALGMWCYTHYPWDEEND